MSLQHAQIKLISPHHAPVRVVQHRQLKAQPVAVQVPEPHEERAPALAAHVAALVVHHGRAALHAHDLRADQAGHALLIEDDAADISSALLVIHLRFNPSSATDTQGLGSSKCAGARVSPPSVPIHGVLKELGQILSLLHFVHLVIPASVLSSPFDHFFLYLTVCRDIDL